MFPIYQQCLLCLKRTGLAAEMWNTKSPQIYIAMSLFSFSPSQLFRKCAETRRRRKRLCITKTSAMKRLENSQFNSNLFTIFVLQATSTHQNPVYANVKITVKDVNDNPPVFIDAPYSGEILENASLGMTVMRVTAVDKDEVKSHWYFLSNLSYWSDFDFVLWWLKKTCRFCTVSGIWFHCGWQSGLVALWISGLKALLEYWLFHCVMLASKTLNCHNGCKSKPWVSHCSPEAPAAGVFTRYLFVKTYLDLKRLLYFRIEWIEQEKTKRKNM